MEYKIYLRTHRKAWALSQQQIADLVGIRARSVISSYERGVNSPSFRTALAYQFVFGVPLTKMFPDLAGEIEEDVMRRALQIDEAHRNRTDATAVRAREFLQQLLGRASCRPRV
ncbi:MAG: helix-turn-helix transcriptional regulator [Caulobacterales bacterium]